METNDEKIKGECIAEIDFRIVAILADIDRHVLDHYIERTDFGKMALLEGLVYRLEKPRRVVTGISFVKTYSSYAITDKGRHVLSEYRPENVR